MLKNFMVPAPSYMLWGKQGEVILGQPAGGTIFTNDLYGGKPQRVASMSGLGALGTGGPYGPSDDPTETAHHKAPAYVLDIKNYNPTWVKQKLSADGWDQYFGETAEFLYQVLSRQNVSPQQSWWALVREKYGPKPSSPVDCSSVPSDISWQNLKAFGQSIGISNFMAWNGESAYETACRLLKHRQVMREAQAASGGGPLIAPSPVSSMSTQSGAFKPTASTTMFPVTYPSPSVELRSTASGTQAPMTQPMSPSQPMDMMPQPVIGPRDGSLSSSRMVIQNIWEELIVSFFAPRGVEILPSMQMTPAVDQIIQQNLGVLRPLASGDLPAPGDESPSMRLAITKIVAAMMTDPGVRAIMQSEEFPVATYYAKLAATGRADVPAQVPPKSGGNLGLLIGASVVGAGLLWFYLGKKSTPAAG